MEIGDKIIWSDHYGYDVGWLSSQNNTEASFKLITGTRKGATVSKPIEQVEGFTEENYERHSKRFGEKIW